MNLPLISVIIPCYNAEDHILQSLVSVLNQEGIDEKFELELIVVDDCSSDNTVQILKENNINYFTTKENSGGPNAGRNMGLRKSNGDFICFMDHDDIWMKKRLITQLANMSIAPISTCGYILENTVKGVVKTKVSSGNTNKYYAKNETFRNILSKNNHGQITYFGSLMIDKSLNTMTFEEKYGVVDFDWLLAIFHNNPSVEVCEPLFIRKVDGSNLSLNHAYRELDFKYSLEVINNYRLKYPLLSNIGYKRIHEIKAKFHYLSGEMEMARTYLWNGQFTLKNIAYYFTSFIGHKWVRKKFEIF